jgi:hypothetical protein
MELRERTVGMTTLTLDLTDDQLIALLKQLPPERQRAVLGALKSESDAWWVARHHAGEQQMRRLAAERGMNWDVMSESDREAFADDLVHEARA